MVSVVLVTYNRAERLRLSIQDILDQSFRQFELLICDDHSSDNGGAINTEMFTLDLSKNNSDA